VGESPEQAWQIYQDACGVLLEEAGRAGEAGVLPE
jgi:hypothetical protein